MSRALLTLKKAYTEGSRWGMTLAYTYSETEKTGGDLFSLDYPSICDSPRYPTAGDERHRVVLTGIVGLPWDLKLSTFITLGPRHPLSDRRSIRRHGSRADSISVLHGASREAFVHHSRRLGCRSVDLRLEKAFAFGQSQKLTLVAEAFNVFDDENFDPASCNGNIPGPGQPANQNFGQPAQLLEPGRRQQFGASYSF